jgi:ankyrin repeat protein
MASSFCAGSGLTALHLAALKGSHAALRELLRAGASADIGTLLGVHSPQLSRGSTALHIAASRGHAGCVAALLDHQVGIPGVHGWAIYIGCQLRQTWVCTWDGTCSCVSRSQAAAGKDGEDAPFSVRSPRAWELQAREGSHAQASCTS